MPRRTRRTTYRETPESSPLPLDDNESSQVHPDTTEAQNQVPLEEAKREGEAHAQQQPALLTAETDSQPAVSSPKLTREPTWDSQLGSSSSPMDRSSYHSPAWGAGTGEAAGYSVESIFSPPRPAAATTTTTTEGTSKEPKSTPPTTTMNDSNVIGGGGTDLELAPDVMKWPVGSFAEDSPPRDTLDESETAAPPARSSPAPPPARMVHSLYSHPMYANPHSMPWDAEPWRRPEGVPMNYHYTFGFQPQPYSWGSANRSESFWKSPAAARDASFLPPETKIRMSPAKTRDADVSSHKTPTKSQTKKGDPFRSPPSDMKFRMSPFFQGSPAIAGLGSFGMDTPVGNFGEEFSLMGRSFDDTFANDTSFEPKVNLAVTNPAFSGQEKASVARPGPEPVNYRGTLSPFERNTFHGVSQSPVATSTQIDAHYPGVRPPLVASMDRSHMAPVSAPRHGRQLYPTAPGSAMRMELGHRPATTQRFLQGINSKMQRAQQQLNPSSAAKGPPSAPIPYAARPPQRYHPIVQGHPGAAMSFPRQAPHPGHQYQRPKPPTTTIPPASTPKPRDESGKENPPKKTPKQRKPCNCKKTKCLKLYCECFSQDLYCQGCSCSECRNLSQYEPMRDKAMKDARVKNPQAFLDRVSSTHNMGCRCKRSECLKKYCECFEARVLCGSKCKCNGCMNRAGSQKLIDKRRKMKDSVGAEFAMREAEKTWKAQIPQRKPQSLPPRRPPPPMQTPKTQADRDMSSSSHATMPAPISAHSASHHYPPPHHYLPYMAHPMGPIGYSPMGMPAITPAYGQPLYPDDRQFPIPPPTMGTHHSHLYLPRHWDNPEPKRLVTEMSERAAAPKKSKKSQMLFCPSLELPVHLALEIFSYLAGDEQQRLSLVCHSWSATTTKD